MTPMSEEQLPPFVTDHYKVTMHSDGRVCVLICKYCLTQVRPVDSGGRRNWLGAHSHTHKHVNAVLRRRKEQSSGL
jgi:hypothetical protein